MRSRALLLVCVFVMAVIPVTNAQSNVSIIIDWDEGHAYKVLGANLDGDIIVEITRNGSTFSPEFEIQNISEGIEITVSISPEYGDEILVMYDDIHREIRATAWNQPLFDHEVTTKTNWQIDQSWEDETGPQEYRLNFSGQGWQKGFESEIQTWELGEGDLTMLQTTNESTTLLTLLLESIWMNQSIQSGQLKSQFFDAKGNGNLAITASNNSDGLSIQASVSQANINRSQIGDIIDEYQKLEANGTMSMSIQEDDSLTEIDGEIAVLYIETRDVGGKRVLDHSQLEGQADFIVSDESTRMDLSLDLFSLIERWENDSRVIQLYELDGDGTFGFIDEEENASVNINGTVVDFHNKIEDGFWVIDDLHVDGQISGDASGSFGVVRSIEQTGKQLNDSNVMIDVVVIHQEDWFNLTGAGGWSGGDGLVGSTHNESWSYDAVNSDWENRTVKIKWRQTGPDPSTGEEIKERSPVIRDPEPPEVQQLLGDVIINREQGLVPLPLQTGDKFVLDKQHDLSLSIVVGQSMMHAVDGHDISCYAWNGTYSGGATGQASGVLISEGPLEGLNGYISRSFELPFDDIEQDVVFQENQSIERILSPSVVSSADNSPPEIMQIHLEGSIINEGGGQGLLQITVDDVDFNMQSVTVDFTALGLGVISLSDKGLKGDKVIGDDVWTATIGTESIIFGEKEFTAIAIDAFGATTSSNFTLEIGNQAPRLTQFEVIPASIARGEMAVINVHAIDDNGVSSVWLDLREYGGERLSLQEENGIWASSFIIPDDMNPGKRILTIELIDEAGESIFVTTTQKSGQHHAEHNDDEELSIMVLNTAPTIVFQDQYVIEMNNQNQEYTFSIQSSDLDGVQSVEAKLGVFSIPGDEDTWQQLTYVGNDTWSISVTVRKGVNIGTHEIQYRATDVFGSTSTIYSTVAKVVEESGDNGAIDSDVLSNIQLTYIGLFILPPIALGVVFVLIRRSGIAEKFKEL